MPRNQIPTTDPGVYLYRAPSHITAEINDHALVVWCVPSHQTCGIVVAPLTTSRKNVEPLLETLHRKFTRELKPPAHDGFVKIFGARDGHARLLTMIETWFRARHVPVAAKDTGRGVARTLTIECGTGRVGVQYAESSNPAVFFTPGSARQRLAPNATSVQMLLLVDNPTRRHLAKQAIEEHRNWVAEAPKDTKPTLKNTKFKKVDWTAVLVSEDCGERDKVKAWLLELQKQRPAIKRLWSGDTLPSFAGKRCELRQLPPIDSVTIDLFKEELATALTEETASEPSTANVIPFPKRRRKAIRW